MKYRLNILIVIIGILFLSGCDVNNSNNYQQFYHEFNGTWQPVHSVSDHPIDANLDGKASRFLLEEIPNWDVALLSLQILKDSDGDEYPNLIDLPYPRQSFPPESNLGDPGFFINYLGGGVLQNFKITRVNGHLSIQLQPNSNADYSPTTSVDFKSVEIKRNHLILEVVLQIRLLTAEGWQTVKVTTQYARIGAVT